jgi:hypothetical protein
MPVAKITHTLRTAYKAYKLVLNAIQLGTQAVTDTEFNSIKHGNNQTYFVKGAA